MHLPLVTTNDLYLKLEDGDAQKAGFLASILRGAMRETLTL